MADYTGNGAIQRGGTLQGVIRHLLEVDALEVLVLVDNVTDSLSTVPRDVRNETTVLRRAGSLPMSAGEYR